MIVMIDSSIDKLFILGNYVINIDENLDFKS